MFERYTEQARRALYFARFECAQLGDVQITPQHLLLGLLREARDVRQLVPADRADAIRVEILELPSESPAKLPGAVDLPLSDQCKRVFAFAAEEAERLHHQHIGPVHELLGLLREPGPACEILERHGVTLDNVRVFAIAQGKLSAEDETTRRESLRTLVDGLPAEALNRVHLLLSGIGTGRIGGGGRGMIGHRFLLDNGDWTTPGRRLPQMPSGNSESTTELRRSFDGREVTLIEHVKLSEDRKTLLYTLELRGPTKTHHWSVDLDLS